MLGTSESSGPLGFPARNLELSVAMVMVRGVWHSPQWATARTRYSPRATPDVGADVGGVSLGANAASQAGRNTLSNIGTLIFFGWLGRGAGRIAVMICSWVQPPRPVSRSGVMLVA